MQLGIMRCIKEPMGDAHLEGYVKDMSYFFVEDGYYYVFPQPQPYSELCTKRAFNIYFKPEILDLMLEVPLFELLEKVLSSGYEKDTNREILRLFNEKDKSFLKKICELLKVKFEKLQK